MKKLFFYTIGGVSLIILVASAVGIDFFSSEFCTINSIAKKTNASKIAINKPETISQQTISNDTNRPANLDENQHLTPAFSQNITGIENDFYIDRGIQIKTPRIKLSNGSQDDLAGSTDSIWMGGYPLPPIQGSTSDIGTYAPLNIFAHPYGNYNNGCALCIAATGGTQQNFAGRAAISGGDWRMTVRNNFGAGDLVGFYEHLDNAPARLVLTVSSFTSTSVTLASPLSAAQQNLMRRGAYIWTNAIDPTVVDKGTEKGLLPTPKYYAAYVTGWFDNIITVNGWTVKDQPASTPSVPDATKLDTVYSNRTHPTIWIGSPSKVFARNIYASYNEQSAGSETSLARDFSGEEMDFRYYATKPNSVRYTGIVIAPQAEGGIGDAAFTTNSFGIAIAGGVPVGLLLDGSCNTHEIVGWSVYHGSNCSGMDATTSVGETFTLSEQLAVANNDSIRYITRLQQDEAGKYPNLYTGPIITSGRQPTIYNTHDMWYGHLNGSMQGSIKYDLNDGSISLCATKDKCGISVLADGKSVVKSSSQYIADSKSDNGRVSGRGSIETWNNYKNGYEATEFVNVNLGKPGGFIFYDVNAGNSVTDSDILLTVSKQSGVNIHKNLTLDFDMNTSGNIVLKGGGNIISKNRDENLSILLNGQDGSINAKTIHVNSLIIPFRTPKDSKSTCTKGEIVMDATYIYTCISANKWHRIRNGESW